jgi:AcrR family transcriptional regulator
MARPKAIDHERQRNLILTKATAAFAELGYPSASMAQLAQACGLSKAALYHYFPSKEALLFESLDRYTRRLIAKVEGVGARSLSATDELGELVRTLLIEYRDSRELHIALLNDVRYLEPALREQIRAQERAVVDVLGECLRKVAPERFSADERKPATMALLGMINFTFAWLRPDGPMSYERYAQLVIELWDHGLQAAPPCAASQSASAAQ